MDPRNVARAEKLFLGILLKLVKGSRYLGRFIRDEAAENRGMVGKV